MNKFLLIFLIPIICYAKTIKVMEIDSGVDISHQEIKSHVNVDDDYLSYFDEIGHGTAMAGIILKDTCKEVKLISCSYFNPGASKGSMNLYMDCLKLAIRENPNVINISAGGPDFDVDEFNLLSILSNMGIKIVVAAGNDGKDLSKSKNKYYPAKYKIPGIIPVGNLESSGLLHKSSNYGLKNEVYELGTEVKVLFPNNKTGTITGTSPATAQKTNNLLKEMCKKNGS